MTEVRARVAWVLAGLTVVLTVADVVVTAQYRPLLSEAAVAEHGFPFVNGAVLGSAVLGAVIIARYERHPVGWLLSLVGSTGAFSLLTEAYAIWVVAEGGPGSRSLAGVSGWLSALVGGQLAIGGLALMFLLAPDGQFLSRRWRNVAAVPAVGMLLCTLSVLTSNPTTFDLQSRDSGPVRGLLLSLGFLLISRRTGRVGRLHGGSAEEEPRRESPAGPTDRPVRGRWWPSVSRASSWCRAPTVASRPGRRRCRCSSPTS